jgi:hypothetical protein
MGLVVGFDIVPIGMRVATQSTEHVVGTNGEFDRDRPDVGEFEMLLSIPHCVVTVEGGVVWRDVCGEQRVFFPFKQFCELLIGIPLSRPFRRGT